MDNNDLIKVEIQAISVSSQISSNGYVLLLKESDGERRLPIIIGQFEAQAITFELEGLKPPRPLTHDLLKIIIENLGYQINSVVINELKDGTFFAKIKFDAIEIEDVDARPSDAITMSLKFNVPIYVAKEVIDEVGFIPEQIRNNNFTDDLSDITDTDGLTEDNTETINDKETILNKLKSELDEAVNKEEYEKAAKIRDEIKKIDISNLN